ncbi:MAG: zinc ABC transporter substrate-binding protein [Firmicutes bacterium]|nr:zinc ABC transporter substrate-binding protein [Bacillota bacterium]
MKRIFKGLFLIGLVLMLSTSCIKRDDMENIEIYTTIYPINYIIERLYGSYSTINSIYPTGVDIDNYEFTDKQLNDFANGTLFIYNGLSNEKQVARKLININRELKIIDVAYGLKNEYGDDDSSELWLSPNNYLMLATTLKNNLIDYIDNNYIKDEIEKNYKKLQEELSLIDAEMRTIASSSAQKSKNTIIVAQNSLKYLENYGFNVISLEDSKNYTNQLKANFDSETYKYIFSLDGKTNDKVDDLVKNHKAQIVTVNTMKVLSDEEVKNNEDYINITRTFIKNLSDVVL